MELAEDITVKTIRLPVTLDGGHLTSLSRDLVRDGRWRAGYEILLEGIEGLESQDAIDILKGKSRLAGRNTLMLEADDQEAEMAKVLAYRLRDLFQWRGIAWRIYGTVGYYNRKDWDFANSASRGSDDALSANRYWRAARDELSDPGAQPMSSRYTDAMQETLAMRPLFYLDDRRNDVLFSAFLGDGHGQPVLAAPVREDVPLWVRLPGADKAAELARVMHKEGRLLSRSTPEEVTLESPKSRLEPARAKPALAAELRRPEDDTSGVTEIRRAEPDESSGQRLESIRRQVVEAADAEGDAGWLSFREKDRVTGEYVAIRVPARAIRCLALSRAHAQHLMPDYQPFSPFGAKMAHDNPFHTDAWLGTGLPLDDAYDEEIPEVRLFNAVVGRIQDEALRFPFEILARGSADRFTGVVTHDPQAVSPESVLVVKEASPEYAAAAMGCRAVIVETGSKLAHMVVVSREGGVPVLRMTEAVARLPEGRILFVNLGDGHLELFGMPAAD